MAEGVDAVDPAAMALTGRCRDALSRASDAPDGWQDPYLVTGADASVRTDVAPEAALQACYGCGSCRLRMVAVAALSQQRRVHVMGMDMIADRDVAGRASDRKAVFQDQVARRDGPQCDLVPACDRLPQCDALAIENYSLFYAEVAKGGGDMIVVVDAQGGPVCRIGVGQHFIHNGIDGRAGLP